MFNETWTQGDPRKQEETFPHKLVLRDNIVSQAASHSYWGVIPMDLPRYMYSLGGMMAERQGLCCQSAMERFCGYRHWPLMCTLLQRSYHPDIVGIVIAVSPHLKPQRVTAAVVWFCISERFRSRYVPHLARLHYLISLCLVFPHAYHCEKLPTTDPICYTLN